MNPTPPPPPPRFNMIEQHNRPWGGPGGGRGGRRFPEQHADGKKVLERI